MKIEGACHPVISVCPFKVSNVYKSSTWINVMGENDHVVFVCDLLSNWEMHVKNMLTSFVAYYYYNNHGWTSSSHLLKYRNIIYYIIRYT